MRLLQLGLASAFASVLLLGSAHKLLQWLLAICPFCRPRPYRRNSPVLHVRLQSLANRERIEKRQQVNLRFGSCWRQGSCLWSSSLGASLSGRPYSVITPCSVACSPSPCNWVRAGPLLRCRLLCGEWIQRPEPEGLDFLLRGYTPELVSRGLWFAWEIASRNVRYFMTPPDVRFWHSPRYQQSRLGVVGVPHQQPVRV
jgi:hypothetical protein